MKFKIMLLSIIVVMSLFSVGSLKKQCRRDSLITPFYLLKNAYLPRLLIMSAIFCTTVSVSFIKQDNVVFFLKPGALLLIVQFDCFHTNKVQSRV